MVEFVFLKSKREKDLIVFQILWNGFFLFVFCDRFTDQFWKPIGANPCPYAPRKIRVFWSWLYLPFAQANCEMCWFVQGINRSTGFAMKMFTHCELFSTEGHSFSSSSVLLHICFFLTFASLISIPLCFFFTYNKKVELAQIYQSWHLEETFSPFFFYECLMPCSCLISTYDCQILLSQTLCSSGIYLMICSDI